MLEFLKNYLFPFFCADCGREGEWWCGECRGKVSSYEVGALTLEKVTALFNYSGNRPVEKLIREFKYNYARDIRELWVEILEEARLKFSAEAVFIPVPLHGRRQRERGFNQAEELSSILAKIYRRPEMNGSLRRVRETAQQATMTREERLRNVAGAFAWVSNQRAPRHVVLVDDVYTTGATMAECARVLRSHGAKYIEAIVLAHG